MIRLGFSNDGWDTADHWYSGKADRMAAREARQVKTTIETHIQAIISGAANYTRLQDNIDCRSKGIQANNPPTNWDEVFDAFCQAQTALITDWNTAVKAMEGVVACNVKHYENAEWFCHVCKGGATCEPERHTPDKCFAAACQVALKEMKGNADGGS